MRIQLISQFIAYGAPISALSSDLAKAAMIKLRFDLPLGQSIRIVLYERICGALSGAIVIEKPAYDYLAARDRYSQTFWWIFNLLSGQSG